MNLTDYYFADARLVLVPIEHLHRGGMSDAFAAAVVARRAWTRERLALFDGAFTLYWNRTDTLARRTRTWRPPRLRHVAVLDEPLSVHPYAQLLNASAWTLYACDLDPDRSHAELAAYLLAQGDRMMQLGEVTMAALHNAAWWFERSDAECAAFVSAAAASTRPDAAALRAVAGALPWLRRLGHARLRPLAGHGHRSIPRTDLQVPARLGDAPQQLVDRITTAARGAADSYADTWRAADLGAVGALTDWLAATAPPLLVCCRGGRVVWDPDAATRLAPLRSELERASGAAVRDMHEDLRVLDRQTQAFRAALVSPAELPPPDPAAEQRGYTYLHVERVLLVYDLDEPGIDRRSGPALPFARAMLGARAMHEWTHLAAAAGWVPLSVPGAEFDRRVAELAAQLDAAVAAAPHAIRAATADDLAALAARAHAPAGTALARLLLRRRADFQANLLAVRYLDLAERETYVRQNVRTLRGEYGAAQRWRCLVRYLYELQYLRFSAVADGRSFFLRSTWFDSDFLATGMLDDARFDALCRCVATVFDGYAVDERKVRPRSA